MKITIFGAAYVGLVTGTCLAEIGNHVLCVDVNAERVARLKNGECRIHEPDLHELMKKNLDAGRLSFTANPAEGIAHGFYQFIAVGTPQDEDGSADLQYVLAVANSTGEHITEPPVVINKSTVPVSTADKVRNTIQQALDKRGVNVKFDVASNPEFLREGAAGSDFMASASDECYAAGEIEGGVSHATSMDYTWLTRQQCSIVVARVARLRPAAIYF